MRSLPSFWRMSHRKPSHIFDSLIIPQKSFYRSFNAILGKIIIWRQYVKRPQSSRKGRIASKNVLMQLIKSKCVPVLSMLIEFPLTRIIMKVLKKIRKKLWLRNTYVVFSLVLQLYYVLIPFCGEQKLFTCSTSSLSIRFYYCLLLSYSIVDQQHKTHLQISYT